MTSCQKMQCAKIENQRETEKLINTKEYPTPQSSQSKKKSNTPVILLPQMQKILSPV